MINNAIANAATPQILKRKFLAIIGQTPSLLVEKLFVAYARFRSSASCPDICMFRAVTGWLAPFRYVFLTGCQGIEQKTSRFRRPAEKTRQMTSSPVAHGVSTHCCFTSAIIARVNSRVSGNSDRNRQEWAIIRGKQPFPAAAIARSPVPRHVV
jgi:hypothetical protein